MKVAIHQPEYWPLPRLLHKWRSADLLIVLDIVQLDRSSLQHRCKLMDAQGQLHWLTIPYMHLGQPQQLRVLEPADAQWALKHWWRVKEYYRDADPERLGQVQHWFDTVLRENSIANYAWESMVWITSWLRTMPPAVHASSLLPPPGGWGAQSQLVLNLCKAVRATTYLSGRSGASYLDLAAFERAGVPVQVQAYTQEPPELSSLHVFLSKGPDALLGLLRR